MKVLRMNILQKIADERKIDVARAMKNTPLRELEEEARSAPPVRNFAAALTGDAEEVRIIAEIKAASPSRGAIRPDLDAAWMAARYEEGGAVAVSVLTEPHHFKGGPEHLKAARASCGLPVLRKDFILSGYQVVESRVMGADSLLLIVALLDEPLLSDLISLCRWWGMEPLVEVHDREELDVAIRAGAAIIGVNNRDLTTFRVDVETSMKLAVLMPPDVVAVSESGIKSRGQIRALQGAGYHAFLVGEHLCSAEDPAGTLRELVGAGR